MAAEHESGDVLDADPEFLGQEMAEARAIEHAGHADHHIMGQPRELAQRPDHRVEWVGDADDERVRGVRLDARADRLHHAEVDAEQIVAAHARLARNPGGDDAHVRAGDVGVIGCALQLRVEIVDGAGLGDVERLSFRNTLGDVEQDDVAEFAHRGEVSQRAADHSGADQRDFFPSHGAGPSLSAIVRRAGSRREGAAPD